MPLQHDPAKILKKLLVDLGHVGEPATTGTHPAWPCWATGIPDGTTVPDDIVAITNTQGSDSGRTQPDGEVNRREGIQVMIRSLVPDTGRAKAGAILTALESQVRLNTVTIGNPSVTYLVWNCARIGQIIPLGKESPTSERRRWTINCELVVEQVT